MGHIVYVLDTKPSGFSVWDNTSYDNHASKVHGPNMGPIWGRQDPGGPHVGPMNFAIGEDLPTYRSDERLRSDRCEMWPF